MLQLYDVDKIKVQGLTEYKDYKIESVLDSGDKTLSFSYPSILSNSILEECYIRNETDEFVIKEIKDDGKWKSVVAVMNVEELEGQAWEHFDLPNIGVKKCLTLIVAGTSWKVEISDNISKKRTVKKTNCSSWDLIQEVKKSYRVEIEFDTLNKTIKVYEKIGSNKGSYFIDTLNLKELELETDSYDYYTKIIAIGKSDIKVEVENYQYSNKVKTLIWKDEKYTDVDALREDAILKLNEISKPRKSYRASIVDLARLSDKYKNILEYKLGDVVTLISKDLKIKDKQRIVKITEYPDDPSKNDCEMSNTILSFKELQKEFKDTSSTVSNITEDNGKISEKAIKEAVDKITIDKVDTKSLNAVSARIGELDVNKLNANEAKIKFAEIDNALITKLETKDLVANNIKFNVASGDTLDLQTLLSKFVTGENGQFLNITSNNITIADAVIKDAMIDTISAAKINTGVLYTNLVNIQGNNGNLLIRDNTIQIKDGNKTRVQIGKDASDDYNMYVWDATGKLMFDATGLKADGIKNQIIRNDMISDNANINGKKMDINSLVTEVNKDSNTTLMKASKVALDTTGQSLEVSFNLLKTSSDDTKKKTESNITKIGVINGQIDTLIKDTTIDEDGSTIKLKDSYSSLKQTVSGLNSTVESHSTSITNAQNTANTANSLADSKAKIFTSTPNTPYKVGDMWTSGPSSEIMKCKVSRTSGAYTASDWEKASKYTDDTKANAVEGSLNTLSGKVTTVENKQANLEQSLDGFKTTVSSNYSTKSEMYSVDGRVTNLNSRVSTAESSITQLNNQIDLKVEKTDVTNAINGIQIGGRNLVLDTGFKSLWSIWNPAKSTATINELGQKLMFNDIVQSAILSNLTEKLAKGEKYTLSFEARGNLNKTEVYIITTTLPNFQIFAKLGALNENNYTKITFTFTYSYDNISSKLFIGGISSLAGQWIEVKKGSIKLEKGTKETDWTVAPEDIDSSVNALSGRMATAELKLEPGRITQSISDAINGGTASIFTVTTVLDKTGFTVKNGAIRILNKAGQDVLKADVNGNLILAEKGKVKIGDSYFGEGGTQFFDYVSFKSTESESKNIYYSKSGYIHPGVSGQCGLGTPSKYFDVVFGRALGLPQNQGNNTVIQGGAIYLRTAYKAGVDNGVMADEYGYIFPYANAEWTLGRPDKRWSTVYTYNVNTPSDSQLKENIRYTNDNDIGRISTRNCYDFIKNDLKLAEFDYKGNDQALKNQFGFIAQDVLNYSNRYISEKVLNIESSTLSYNSNNYINVVVGALQIAIKKIEELEDKIKSLQM
ncbi:phage tail spike protein [Clostridium sp. CTA-7]